uniref:Uncharacterized protein n=1 Tax=Molossus molossus TaxID=27622 RepID=A0A7J8BYJ8_MOLMO|nr:hypothetical protein HJG59_010073 [Molossus molossus]
MEARTPAGVGGARIPAGVGGGVRCPHADSAPPSWSSPTIPPQPPLIPRHVLPRRRHCQAGDVLSFQAEAEAPARGGFKCHPLSPHPTPGGKKSFKHPDQGTLVTSSCSWRLPFSREGQGPPSKLPGVLIPRVLPLLHSVGLPPEILHFSQLWFCHQGTPTHRTPSSPVTLCLDFLSI